MNTDTETHVLDLEPVQQERQPQQQTALAVSG